MTIDTKGADMQPPASVRPYEPQILASQVLVSVSTMFIPANNFLTWEYRDGSCKIGLLTSIVMSNNPST